MILFDDTIDRGQPEAGAFADSFGREERLKDIGQRVLVHAAAVIAHSEQYILAGDSFFVSGAIVLI